jgi:hypothetical protein
MNNIIPKSKLLESKLKSCDPSIKKHIAELESIIIQLDLENSRLRIDKKRLEVVVKSLETEISKHPAISSYDADQMEQMRNQALKEAKDSLPKKVRNKK